MIVAFKISNNTREKMVKYYENLKRDKTPDYALFQAEEGGTIITLYQSNKVVFQGVSADVDANIWKETEAHLNNGIMPIETNKEKIKKTKEDIIDEKKEFYYISSIGSDEVGTGDYFGPIIVSSAYVNKDDIMFLEDLGVKDSKKLTDEKILSIAPTIIDKIPHKSVIYNNIEYNENYSSDMNMNKIKAILHNKVLLGLLKKQNFIYDKVVVDQFVYPKKYFMHLANEKNVFRKITFTTKAEDKCLSVACASLISRYIFLKEMDKLSAMLKITVPKGAGTVVDQVGIKIVKKYGIEKLKEVAKLNFKNTDKIKKELEN